MKKCNDNKSVSIQKQAIKDQKPSMNVPGVVAWMDDTFISADADKRICAGFFD